MLWLICLLTILALVFFLFLILIDLVALFGSLFLRGPEIIPIHPLRRVFLIRAVEIYFRGLNLLLDRLTLWLLVLDFVFLLAVSWSFIATHGVFLSWLLLYLLLMFTPVILIVIFITDGLVTIFLHHINDVLFFLDIVGIIVLLMRSADAWMERWVWLLDEAHLIGWSGAIALMCCFLNLIILAVVTLLLSTATRLEVQSIFCLVLGGWRAVRLKQLHGRYHGNAKWLIVWRICQRLRRNFCLI